MEEIVIAGFNLSTLLLIPSLVWGIILIGDGGLIMMIYLAKKGVFGKFWQENMGIKKEGKEKIIRFLQRFKRLFKFFIFAILIWVTLKTMFVIIFEQGIMDSLTAKVIFMWNYFLIFSCFLPSYISFVFITIMIKMLPIKD